MFVSLLSVFGGNWIVKNITTQLLFGFVFFVIFQDKNPPGQRKCLLIYFCGLFTSLKKLAFSASNCEISLPNWILKYFCVGSTSVFVLENIHFLTIQVIQRMIFTENLKSSALQSSKVWVSLYWWLPLWPINLMTTKWALQNCPREKKKLAFIFTENLGKNQTEKPGHKNHQILGIITIEPY